MTNKQQSPSETSSTEKPALTLAAGATQSPSDPTTADTRNDLLDDGNDMDTEDLAALYHMGDDVADEIFQGITDAADCQHVKCRHLGKIDKNFGFDCDVYAKKESPSLCPVTQARMSMLRDALIIWTDDFGEGKE